MARGKQTCRILKEIRRQIAEANDIKLITSECTFRGDCLGTCPKCEAEVSYLEQQLRARTLAGKAVALAGISAAALTMLASSPIEAQELQSPQQKVDIGRMTGCMAPGPEQDTLKIKGTVVGADSLADGTVPYDPVWGAVIKNSNLNKETVTDSLGNFTIPANPGDILMINYVGYYDQKILVPEDMHDLKVILIPDPIVLGEVVRIEDAVIVPYLDLKILDEHGRRIDPENISVERIWTDEDGEEESETIDTYNYNEDLPCLIHWDYGNGLVDDDGIPLKEATFRIEAEGYDEPVIIKVKAPKRKAKKTVKFKRKKD